MSVLGIHITAHGLLLAKAKRSGSELMVRAKDTLSLTEEGMENGVLRPQAAGSALRTFLEAHPELAARSAVLCFSPEQVYVTTLTVSSVKPDVLEREMSRWLPDELRHLTYAYRIVRRDRTHIEVAVIALRKDVLDGAKGMCAAAGVRVAGMTTVSHALWTLFPHDRASALLVTAGITLPTITLFVGKTALDEAVLPETVSSEGMLQEAEYLAAEYHDRLPARDVFVCLPDAVQQSPAWCTIHPLLPEVEADDRPYLGALAASLMRGSVLHRRRINPYVVLPGAIMLAALVLAAVTLRSSLPALRLPGSPAEAPSAAEEEGRASLATDVPADHPAYEALAWALAEGIFEEDASGALSPDRPMLRSEFLILAVDRTADEDIRAIILRSGHDDVSDDDFFLPHLRFATREGIVGGTLFRPLDAITIAEALKMGFLAYGVTVPNPVEGEAWFAPYVRTAQERGIAFATIAADAPLTRAQAAELFRNLSSS